MKSIYIDLESSWETQKSKYNNINYFYDVPSVNSYCISKNEYIEKSYNYIRNLYLKRQQGGWEVIYIKRKNMW